MWPNPNKIQNLYPAVNRCLIYHLFGKRDRHGREEERWMDGSQKAFAALTVVAVCPSLQ